MLFLEMTTQAFAIGPVSRLSQFNSQAALAKNQQVYFQPMEILREFVVFTSIVYFVYLSVAHNNNKLILLLRRGN